MVQTKSSASRSSGDRSPKKQQGITAITVQGYKALQHEERLAIAPLTLLSGANSSGKSSIMQPILLMKQTLEASYDPGALLLDGPHLKFTSAEQLFTHTFGKKSATKEFKIGLEIDEKEEITCTFQKTPKKAIDLLAMDYQSGDSCYSLTDGMGHEQLMSILPQPMRNFFDSLMQAMTKQISKQSSNEKKIYDPLSQELRREETPRNSSSEIEIDNLPYQKISQDTYLVIERSRCFFEILLAGPRSRVSLPVYSKPAERVERSIQKIIHVPGLRGNPERTYKTTAVGGEFPGTFENYVASIVHRWQLTSPKKLKSIENSLQELGLTTKLESKQINDTQVELRVGRLPCNSRAKPTRHDMVSIADVGFGVSQILPVLVALLAANPGQLVYIEQPEIHLHPRAQVALAKVLAEAANRGVRVVVETHSELLLLGVQALVAEGQITPDKIKLHWFTREDDGATKITSADLDETGAFGDWPEDFGEVTMAMQNRYLSAAEARLWKDK